MKTAAFMLALIPVAAAAVPIAQTETRLEELENGIIRLHIRADSDSTADQTAKLAVRDAVLQFAQERLQQDGDYGSQLAAMTDALPEIGTLAQETLDAAGYSAQVTAEIRREHFPSRSYGDVTLPEGDYRALCIEIGSGEGQNWWCVMYPALCLPAAETKTEISEHFDSGTAALTIQPERFAVRLKCVELWRTVLTKLRSSYQPVLNSPFRTHIPCTKPESDGMIERYSAGSALRLPPKGHCPFGIPYQIF